MATCKGESFVWTDSEVELLLSVTNDYKTEKFQESIDWECLSVQSKYVDILARFIAQYRKKSADFPHRKEDITKTIIVNKLKQMKSKYRLAVDEGRRSGFGRVVFLYFEQCEELWGGSPATNSISSVIETSEINDGQTATEDPEISTTEMSEQEDSIPKWAFVNYKFMFLN